MIANAALLKLKPQKRNTIKKTVITARNLVILSVALRVGFFLFGLYQDANMPVPYTDIDYLVFTDAANYMSKGRPPYDRETYRYTPLLAWFLLPNVNGLYSFGKLLFIVCDILTGLIILKILEMKQGISELKKLGLTAIWLLNPMVITISTRGSSESILTVFIMLFVYFLLRGDVYMSGLFIGLSIHFKIYPIIYIPTALLYLSDCQSINPFKLINGKMIRFAVTSLVTLIWLTTVMYLKYKWDYLENSYLYHLTRIDHRHNFSVYNISLYFTSAVQSGLDFSQLAFLPQLLISGILIPLTFAKKSLTSTLFIQTFAFITFNKVITSQYFIWFLIFLPIHLRDSRLIAQQKIKGGLALLLWVVSQGSWLFFAFKLEFLGESTFYPGLLGSSIFFYLSNIYVLGVFIDDTNGKPVRDGI